MCPVISMEICVTVEIVNCSAYFYLHGFQIQMTFSMCIQLRKRVRTRIRANEWGYPASWNTVKSMSRKKLNTR